MKNIFIVMGPTSSGKSSVLEEIKKRGYNVYEEIPKQVINERINYPVTKKEIETRQRIMYKRQKNLEENLIKKSDPCFIERSLVGVLAFSNFYLGSIPSDF